MELLEPFIGLTYNQGDRIFFIWPGTRRCMLKVGPVSLYTCQQAYCLHPNLHTPMSQDLIFDDDFTMTKQFETSFLRDLLRVGGHECRCTPTRPPIQAMQYLHESCQLAHGALNTQSCMISRYWSLKLSDYGLNDVLDELTLADVTTAHEPLVDSELLPSCTPFCTPIPYTALNHIAPELIMERRARSAPFPSSLAGDVYAVGCVMYQILYRQPLISDQQMWSGGSNGCYPLPESGMTSIQTLSMTYSRATVVGRCSYSTKHNHRPSCRSSVAQCRTNPANGQQFVPYKRMQRTL